MNFFFQRKNSKRVKEEADGSPKKQDRDSGRGENDLFDRAKGGLETLAGNLQAAKNGLSFHSFFLSQIFVHGNVSSTFEK
jgi:hypothetical protein